MISLRDWLVDLSENYSVEKIEDVESGTFIENIKGDVYLIEHREAAEK